MHNHGDVQWPSHGSCTACIQNIWQNMVRPVMSAPGPDKSVGGVFGCKLTQRISNIIMESLFQDQKREWGRITKSRRGAGQSKPCHSSYTCITRKGEIRQKNKTYHSHRITLINQQRTSQMMRCPPPPGFKPKSAVCVCLGGLVWWKTSPRKVGWV